MAIPNKTIETHHVGEVKEEFKAGMRAEDFPHLANLLINLYSDPITAIIREYSTNALDAHIDAGVSRPIEITLPTPDSMEFVVQDFGIGLSVDDLRDIYSMYGRSTKRDTNDAVGQLGLGCKSGLTYCDAFTITAVKNGVKCVAMSTKDEHGIGTIRVLDTVSTNEPNGVRIAIPVKTWDRDSFLIKTNELFQFWAAGTVLIDGEAPEVPEWRKQALALDDDTFVVPSSAPLYSSYIVMGNVPYPINDVLCEGKGRNRDFNRRVVAFVNMGDVDFVPSREQVHNTTHTEECLSALSEYLSDRFEAVLAEKLENAPTRWDAAQMRTLWKGSVAGLNARQEMPIWAYKPNAYARQASAHIGYSFSNLMNTDVIVVTKYPNKTLATSHRKRLCEFADDCRLFVVVPEGSDVSALSGRDNVVTWDEVLGETEMPVDPSTGKRVKRDETRYDVSGHGPMTAAEIAKLSGVKLYAHRNDIRNYGDFGATVVEMYSSNQESRLRRLIPGIKPYNEEVQDQRKKAAAAVTAKDRRVWAARQHLPRLYSGLDAAAIDDPELSEAVELANTDRSDSLLKALQLDVGIDAPKDLTGISATLADRYPLFSNTYYSTPHTDEVVLYLNAKYAQIVGQESLDRKAS